MTVSISSMYATWNVGADNTAIGMHVTDSDGRPNTRLIQITVNGVRAFEVYKNGAVWGANTANFESLTVRGHANVGGTLNVAQDLRVTGNLVVSGYSSSSNADASKAFDAANASFATGNNANAWANFAMRTANAAYDFANSAHTRANAGMTTANAAYNAANAANSLSIGNTGYNQNNFVLRSTARTQINFQGGNGINVIVTDDSAGNRINVYIHKSF